MLFESDLAEIGNWLDLDDEAVRSKGFDMKVRIRTNRDQRVECSKIEYKFYDGVWNYHDEENSKWVAMAGGTLVTALQKIAKPPQIPVKCF